MSAKIKQLIQARDNAEIIRDKIAEILLVESTNQQALAEAENLDPALWKLRIYTERSNAWEDFLGPEQKGQQIDKSPIVNVWFESAQDDAHASNTIERQKVDGIFNVDCHGYGIARASEDGHDPGDYLASLEAQRAARQVRQILMSAHYLYLGMQGTVWGRWRDSAKSFQPESDRGFLQNVQGVRVAMRVTFNEVSPQIQPVTLAGVAVTVKRSETGQILFKASFP